MNKIQKIGLFVSTLGTTLIGVMAKAADFDATDTVAMVATLQTNVLSPVRTYIIWGLGILAFIFVVGIGVRIVLRRIGGASKIG